MQKLNPQKALQVLFLVVLVFAGLFYAKPFLVPVCFAGLLAMLFLPLSRKFERLGLNRGLATLCCLLIFLLVITVVIYLISWQVTNLTGDLGNIEEKVESIVQQLKEYITHAFGISQLQQEQVFQQQTENTDGLVARLSSSLMTVLVDFVLVLVYVFLFMFYRGHIKKFILQVIPKKEDDNAEDAIVDIEKVSQQYLTGLGLMIMCLWVMYSIAFSIVGLKNAIFFAILCGLFEIVPFVGNLAGNTLAVLMAVTQGGGMTMVIGIILTYSLVQFLQTYILEPLVVGTEVNINPLFTIVGLVLGELVWGIAGLVLAIPLLAIVKIICDHIPSLKPFGFLIGREKKSKKGMIDKVKIWFD